MSLVTLAMTTARAAHESIGQRREYTKEPYYFHPWNVALHVGEYEVSDNVIAAAALHDVLGDVPGSEAHLRATFPAKVVELVVELTDVYSTEGFPYMNRAERKADEADRIKRTSHEARLIKLCDNLDNMASILEHKPKFAKTYAGELQLYFDALPKCADRDALGLLISQALAWRP